MIWYEFGRFNAFRDWEWWQNKRWISLTLLCLRVRQRPLVSTIYGFILVVLHLIQNRFSRCTRQKVNQGFCTQKHYHYGVFALHFLNFKGIGKKYKDIAIAYCCNHLYRASKKLCRIKVPCTFSCHKIEIGEFNKEWLPSTIQTKKCLLR